MCVREGHPIVRFFNYMYHVLSMMHCTNRHGHGRLPGSYMCRARASHPHYITSGCGLKEVSMRSLQQLREEQDHSRSPRQESRQERPDDSAAAAASLRRQCGGLSAGLAAHIMKWDMALNERQHCCRCILVHSISPAITDVS